MAPAGELGRWLAADALLPTMSSASLFTLMDAVRPELAVPSGRTDWLDIATVGDLWDHVAFARGARSDASRAAACREVAALVARVCHVPVERLRPETPFVELLAS